MAEIVTRRTAVDQILRANGRARCKPDATEIAGFRVAEQSSAAGLARTPRSAVSYRHENIAWKDVRRLSGRDHHWWHGLGTARAATSAAGACASSRANSCTNSRADAGTTASTGTDPSSARSSSTDSSSADAYA